jgi:DNA-binding protein
MPASDEDSRPSGSAKKETTMEATITETRPEGNTVIIGKKDWYSYVPVILGRLNYGPVTVLARGQKGIEKAGAAACLLIKNYPITWTDTITRSQFELEGKKIDVPNLVALVSKVG